MKVLGAYYPPGLIWQMVIVLPDGCAKIANHTPMRHLTENDLRDMAALNNSAYRRVMLTPENEIFQEMYGLYGLEKITP